MKLFPKLLCKNIKLIIMEKTNEGKKAVCFIPTVKNNTTLNFKTNEFLIKITRSNNS